MDEPSNRGASIDSSNWDEEYANATEPPDSEDEWFDALQTQEPETESDKDKTISQNTQWDDEYFAATETPDSEDEWFDALQTQEPETESDKEEAKLSMSEESSYYLRIVSMYIDLGTKVVLTTFVHHSPEKDAKSFLVSNHAKLEELRRKKRLNADEWKLVDSACPNMEKFDISLLITLSINLFSQDELPPPKKGWKNPPRNSDKSISADLFRLRTLRNQIVGHHSTARLSQKEFESKWEEIKTIFLRIYHAIDPDNVEQLERKIDEYKIKRLDPCTENRYDATLKEWHERVRKIQEEVAKSDQKLHDVDKYFKSKPDTYERYRKLLVEGGRFVLSAILEEKTKTESLQEALTWKEDVIRSKIDNANHLRILYPPDDDNKSKTIDTSTWEIPLLANLILHLLGEQLGKQCCHSVRQIYDAHKKYAEAAFEALDSNKFKNMSFDLKYHITLLNFHLDEQSKKDCQNILDKYEGVQKSEEPDYTDLEEPKPQDMLKSIADVHKELLQKTKESLQQIIRHGIFFETEHVVDLKMITLGTDKDKKQLAEDILTEILQEAQDGSGDISDFQALRKIVKDLLKDTRFHVSRNCIILSVECSSPDEVLGRLTFLGSDIFRAHLDNISQELGYHLDTVFKVEANVTAESLHEIVYDIELQSSQVETPVIGEDKDYQKMKTDLQDNLISFYRDQHSTISLSPLIKEDTPVLEFYVMPEIYSVNVQMTQDGVKEVKTPVTLFGSVFYKENKSCRKIYLTADAGLGKTAFSKRLALTWCHAKKPHTEEERFFSQEEIQAMHKFRFVFLLLLRDGSNECDIVDLIWTQVISHLLPLYSREHLENVLFKERCLVILDGLDEWCHPSHSCKQKTSSIPHRKAWEQTAVLTTTRPWKLSVSGLHSSQIDKKLELMGLNKKSANALKKSVISRLCADKNEYEVQQDVDEFTRTLQEKQISDLETIPLLLMYLLFLWCNGIELGQSQCDLYSQIIELLLSRTVQNYQELSPKVDLHQGDIPQCLSQLTHCTQFYSLLKDLGQLAYQTLFRVTRVENTLVFDSSVAELCLNKERLTFCLKTGIITQSKVPGALFPQQSKVSFAHKTVQEFLAALYIRSTPDQTSVPETVLSKCTSVKDILEMSNILIFLSGFNVNVSSLISRELMKIINEDEITRVYRSSLGKSEPLKSKQFQDMCISCCKELQHETEVSFCLQDVFIDDSCQQEQYRENLKKLTSRNKQNIRSLYIDIGRLSDTRAPYSSAHEVIDYFALSDLENIEKIYYNGEYKDRDILPLLKKSVQSLSLSCSESSRSDLLSEKVTSLQNLEAIDIRRFKMSHEQLTLLYEYISHRHCMREIGLVYLECSDHEDSCTGYSLELSKNSQLRKITLGSIPVSELNINMSSIEKCDLQYLSNPDLVLHFINCVPADSKVNAFECNDLKSSAAIKTIQQKLPLLVHVESVRLSRINLGNINLCTSEMVNLECVSLYSVTMPASVLRAIVTVLQQLTQTVKVDIEDCDITPESEFVTVKEEIKQSSQFRVSEDSEGLFGKTLKFETIKDDD